MEKNMENEMETWVIGCIGVYVDGAQAEVTCHSGQLQKIGGCHALSV